MYSLKNKSLIAEAIVTASDMVEMSDDIARCVAGTRILINASQVRIGLIDEIRESVIRMEHSNHKTIRKRHYNKLAKKLAKEYVISM